MPFVPLSVPGFTDPLSSWSHLLAAFAALVGGGFLVRRGRGNGARLFALVLYSFSLIFLFSMSGVFHLLDRGTLGREVLQRLDHAGIWTLIAGTFTPIHIILFRGRWRWLILILVWTLAITGLVLEVVFFDSFPEWMLLLLFLGLGWIGALSGVKFFRLFKDSSVRWLALGGFAYTVGAVIDFIREPILIDGIAGAHELFHLLVVIGAAAHWRFIWTWSTHPVSDRLTFDVRIFPDARVVAQAVGERMHFEAATIEIVKKAIRTCIEETYRHDATKPTIHLRYRQEELL